MRSASGTSSQTDTPSRLIARAVLGVGERAAAGRDDDVAHRLQELEDLAFDRAEVRLAVLREDLGDRQPLAPLDEIVDVLGSPAQPRGQRARDRALAAGHEADEIDLVGRHRRSLARSAAKSGYDTATAPAPVIDRRTASAEPDQRERHDQPMIARRRRPCRRVGRRAPSIDESVGPLVGVDAQRPEARRRAP